METLSALAGIGFILYIGHKYNQKIKRDAQRAQYDLYPATREEFIIIPYDDVTLLKVNHQGTLETVAVFAPSIEIANQYILADDYEFFRREPNTEDSKLPLYLKEERRQIGHPYLGREQHNGGLMLPVGYEKSKDHFYYDCKNFAAVKLHKHL